MGEGESEVYYIYISLPNTGNSIRRRGIKDRRKGLSVVLSMILSLDTVQVTGLERASKGDISGVVSVMYDTSNR